MSGGELAEPPDGGGGFIEGPWPTCAAWLAFAVVAASTLRNVYRHLQNFSRPDLQPHVLRIIVVGPIYAFCAALSLSLDLSARFFVRSVRDIWEAVVIYSFLNLVIEYMGGEHLCLHSISQREEDVPHLFPLNFCLPPIPMGSMIRVPKIGALQFVVVKPLVAAMSIVVYALGELENWYYQWTLFIIYNISYSVALYALYLIYWAAHEHQALQSKRPLLKFVSVKMIVFLTFWQALVLPHVLPSSIGRWEDFILAMEMVAFSLLMNMAFSWQEFHSGLRASQRSCHVGKADGLVDLGRGSQAQQESIGRGQVVQNAKAAFCPRDIMQDASANFSRRYQQHVLIESAQEYELHSSEERKAVDLLGDAALEDPQGVKPNGAAPKAGGSICTLRTFRARTYLIGRSLFAGADAAGQEGDDSASRERAAPAAPDPSRGEAAGSRDARHADPEAAVKEGGDEAELGVAHSAVVLDSGAGADGALQAQTFHGAAAEVAAHSPVGARGVRAGDGARAGSRSPSGAAASGIPELQPAAAAAAEPPAVAAVASALGGGAAAGQADSALARM